MSSDDLKSGDSPELEALFDEVSSQAWDGNEESSATDQTSETSTEQTAVEAASSYENVEPNGESRDAALEALENSEVFKKVGSLTRRLHDALHELGYDKNIESAVNTLPDARDRLDYISRLTGEAADKVLASVETCQTVNDDLAERAKSIDENWDKLFNNEMSLEDFKAHALETRDFVKTFRDQSNVFGSQFTEIIMAQDFHDLTGQVCQRVTSMAQQLEQQLVQLLIETTPVDQRKNVDTQWLSGPVVNAKGRTDVCNDQQQVDDLLESLGF